MNVPDIVKDKWKSQPTAVDNLKRELQTEKTENEITRLKLANAESRISILEQSISSILSKLNV
jgi:hypothetical protein|tara:strand:+ start:1267 stop:1455 length:189 start_codon:yes stop_codon:yes gene_type:complete